MNKQEQSIQWIIGHARTSLGYQRNILKNTQRTRSIATIGKMFFFVYDPKYKKRLPVYDTFPLVFPVESYTDGFLGLNVHYLTIPERKLLLGKLSGYATSQNYTERTRLRLSWDILQSTRGVPSLTSRCIKRYLFAHIRSGIQEIWATEWEMAIDLPMDFMVHKP